MEPNEVLAEIRPARDALMGGCTGELARFGDLRRAGEARWASAGNPVVSFEGQPPVDWEKTDATPENEIIAETRATRRALAAKRDPWRAKEPEPLIPRGNPPEP